MKKKIEKNKAVIRKKDKRTNGGRDNQTTIKHEKRKTRRTQARLFAGGNKFHRAYAIG